MNISFDEHGLIPAVIQDDQTGAVLMLAWMNAEALTLTNDTRQVHFWSRSRREIWRKGATSGNTLDLVSLAADCDGDALLVKARPSGPVCHTGTDTCWGSGAAGSFARLDGLWNVISERVAERPPGSYTASLVEAGPDRPARKVTEEAVEVLMAARDHAAGEADDHRLAEEVADLIYHLMVLTAERGVDPALIFEVLDQRRR